MIERTEIYIEYLKNLREYRTRVYDQLDELNKNTSWKDYDKYRTFLVTRLSSIEANEHRVMRELQLCVMVESKDTKLNVADNTIIIGCNND